MQGLLGSAAPGLDTHALLKANVAAVPKTFPVLSLAFIYHNVIPVIATNLEVGSDPSAFARLSPGRHSISQINAARRF